MSGGGDPDDGLVSGAASMRESAKWLVGGVVATAAGVFAGSSLTRLGSLGIEDDAGRLTAAVLGALAGFFALGVIVHRAVSVLTVGSVTFRNLADAERNNDDHLSKLATQITDKYRGSIPLRASSLTELIEKAENLPPNDLNSAAVDDFAKKVLRDAAFLSVRNRFDRLIKSLMPATALAIVGFGIFAWAANPPSTSAEAPMIVIRAL